MGDQSPMAPNLKFLKSHPPFLHWSPRNTHTKICGICYKSRHKYCKIKLLSKSSIKLVANEKLQFQVTWLQSFKWIIKKWRKRRVGRSAEQAAMRLSFV